jgi:hypothetical protein
VIAVFAALLLAAPAGADAGQASAAVPIDAGGPAAAFAGAAAAGDAGAGDAADPADSDSGCMAAPPQPVLRMLLHERFVTEDQNVATEHGDFADGTAVEIGFAGCVDGVGQTITFRGTRFQSRNRKRAIRALLPFLEAHRNELAQTFLFSFERVLPALREWANGRRREEGEDGVCLSPPVAGIGCVQGFHVALAPGGITVDIYQVI